MPNQRRARIAIISAAVITPFVRRISRIISSQSIRSFDWWSVWIRNAQKNTLLLKAGHRLLRHTRRSVDRSVSQSVARANSEFGLNTVQWQRCSDCDCDGDGDGDGDVRGKCINKQANGRVYTVSTDKRRTQRPRKTASPAQRHSHGQDRDRGAIDRLLPDRWTAGGGERGEGSGGGGVRAR
jgi:hypothetical protein